MTETAPSTARRPTSVTRVIEEIHAMLRARELVPGQQVRQEALANRLGISRVPVREALKSLESEGVLRHEHHVGYTVARLNAGELAQMYLMRRALESEVLRALPRLTSEQVKELSRLNDVIADEVERADVAGIVASNHAFHFAMFELSGLDLVVAEIERLWRRTEPYRTLHLYDHEGRKRIVREHRKMISALRQGDNEAVIDLMNMHRDLTISDLHATLGLPLS